MGIEELGLGKWVFGIFVCLWNVGCSYLGFWYLGCLVFGVGVFGIWVFWIVVFAI